MVKLMVRSAKCQKTTLKLHGSCLRCSRFTSRSAQVLASTAESGLKGSLYSPNQKTLNGCLGLHVAEAAGDLVPESGELRAEFHRIESRMEYGFVGIGEEFELSLQR